MCVSAAVGEGNELCEGVWAFGAAEESRVAALELRDGRGREGGAAERLNKSHLQFSMLL